MGEMFSNVIRYAIWALAVVLAFHFGRAVGFKLLSPWLTRDPTFLFVGGALILGGSVGWTGDRLGAMAARGYKPGYFFTGRAVAGWLLLAFAFVVAFFAGPYLGRLLRPYTAPLIGRDRWLEWLIGGLAIAALIVGFGRGWGYFFRRDAAGKTDWPTRRAVGYFWRFWAGLIAVALPATAYGVLGYALLNFHFSFVGSFLNLFYGDESPIPEFFRQLTNAIIFGPFLVAVYWLYTPVRIAIGRGSRPIRRMVRARSLGAGGSANFGSVLDEWANPWSPGKILLGASLYDPDWLVGVADDRHALTVAGSGGGKGRSVIVPNLLTWPHSVLVVDPKGTNAAVTGAYRGHGGGKVRRGMGQAVYCLNPFNVNAGVAGMPPPSRFNPLSMVDMNGTTVFEDLDLIADALVVPGKADPYWTNSAKSVIRGVTAYALSLNPGATLGDVRDMITHPDGLPIDGMVAVGGVAKESASQLIAASDKELGAIISTTIQQTDWLSDSSELRNALAASDFDFMELKAKACTIYLVLPLEYLSTHSRFLRLFVNLAVKAASKGGASKQPILLVLDEFYSLGTLKMIADASANIRSYGMKLWPIVQNLGQLIELYGANWQGFVANAAMTQFFSTNDPETAQWASEKIGGRHVEESDPAGNLISFKLAPLRTAAEISLETGREGGQVLIFREGLDPLVLRRVNYDKEGVCSDRFNRDPDR